MHAGTAPPADCSGLDGPRDVLDTKELFAGSRAPEISDTQIGALGISLGGGAVWNAAVAGVPFKAIVPVITWTNLTTALAPQGLSKSGLVQLLASYVPQARWDPDLLAAAGSLVTSTNMGTVTALGSTRSPLSHLATLTTPTLLIQGRRDFLFDVDQALAAYKLLKGPKRLYLGDLGHAPGISPATAPDAAIYWGEAVKWFDRYLKGAPATLPPSVIELGHDPYDGKTTTFKSLPATKTISVALPGSTAMSGTTGKVVRSVASDGRAARDLRRQHGHRELPVRRTGTSSRCSRSAATRSPISAGGVSSTVRAEPRRSS